MAKLVFKSGKNAGETFELSGPAILGRGDTVQVRVLDAKASREHCRVFEQAGMWIVVDLNSRNGITVNGVSKTRHTLKDGDKIAIGATVVEFSGAAARAAKPEPPDRAARAAGKAKREAAFAAARKAAGGPTGGGGTAGIEVSDRVLQYSKVDAGKSGLFAFDLGQSPFLFQILVWVFALGFLGLVVWATTELL